MPSSFRSLIRPVLAVATLACLTAPFDLPAQSVSYNGTLYYGPLHVTAFNDSGLPGTYSPSGFVQLLGGGSLIYDGTGTATTSFRLDLWDQVSSQSIVSVTNANASLGLLGDVTSQQTFGGFLVKEGAGELWLLGANTYNRTTINAGTLVFTTFGNITNPNPFRFETSAGNPGLGDIRIYNGATLKFAGTKAVSDPYTGLILGSGGGKVEVVPFSEAEFRGPMEGTTLTKTGSGTLTLSSTASTHAATVIQQGFLKVSSVNNEGEAGSLGLGPVTTQGGFLQVVGNVSASRTLTVGAGGGGLASTDGVLTWGGRIDVASGAALTVTGGGVVALSGMREYTFATRVLDGHLRASEGWGLSSGHLTLDNGILESEGSQFNRTLGTGPGQLTMRGASGFSAVGAGLSVGLNGAWSTVNWSTLGVSALVLNDVNATHRVTLVNSLQIDPGTTATIRSDAGLARIAGSVSGGGTLEVRGAGTVELPAGVTGGTTLWVHGGTVNTLDEALDPSSPLRLDDGILQSSGTFTRLLGSGAGRISMLGTSGFSAVGGNLTVNLGGAGVMVSSSDLPSTLVLNDVAATGTLEWMNPIALQTGDTLTLRSDAGLARLHGVISGEGSLALQDGSFEFLAGNTFTGTMIFDHSHVLVPTIANLGQASALGAGNLRVANGATLEYTGSGVSTDRALDTRNVTDTIVVNDSNSNYLFGAINTVKVATAGATLRFGGTLTGNAGLAVTGSGALELAGGIAMAETASATVNDGGTLILSGTGNSALGALHVANHQGSSGTLEIRGGHVVTGDDHYTPILLNIIFGVRFEDNYSADSTIAYGENTSGSVKVSGPGTIWESRGNISVGKSGHAELTVSGGATVKVGTGATSGLPDAAGTGITRTLYVSGVDSVVDIGSHDLTAPTTGGTIDARQIVLTHGAGSEAFSNALYRAVNGGYPSGPNVPSLVTIAGRSETLSTLSFNQTDTVTLGAAIGGFGDVVQRGRGTTILTGNSDETTYLYHVSRLVGSELVFTGPHLETLGFHGRVQVTGGTLLVNGKLTSAATTVASGGTLGGSGTITQITLQDGARLSPGSQAGLSIGTLTSDTLVWNGGATFVFDLGAGGASDLLDLSGNLTKGTAGTFRFTFQNAGWVEGQTYTLITFDGTTDFTAEDFSFTNGGGFDGDFTVTGNTVQFTPTSAVPEPGTWVLLLGGLLATALLLRRKKTTVSRQS